MLHLASLLFRKLGSFLEEFTQQQRIMAEIKDLPFQFPELAHIDHKKSCPRYNAVVDREEENGSISMEELDCLQLELETMLAAVTRRIRQIQQEVQSMADLQEIKKEKKEPNLEKKEETSTTSAPPSGKRGRIDEKPEKPEKPPKKMKESSGKGGNTSTPGVGSNRPKAKSMSIHQKIQEYEFTDDPLSDVAPPRLPRNDTIDRFWASVEPYCADITNEDLKMLDELIKSGEEETEFFKVPSLGKHYSVRWAHEDLLEEQREGGRITDKKKGPSPNTKEAKAMLKKADRPDDDCCPFGTLTQRLISALVEENIMCPLEEEFLMDSSKEENGTITDGNTATSPKNGNRPFTVPHTKALEARIKEELLAQGLLDVDDPMIMGEEDEVLLELQKRQEELKALYAHNRTQKQRLVKLAKEEIKRQELRQKLRAADNECIDYYRRIMAAKQKKRSPTKKERDAAAKALRDRETIIKQLDTL
ncbi:transcriptional adapter 3 [Strongylocentrotus purpuratus]|uniref:Transcriptional adapter 3-like n=1 Tax=Strongylocentrotus purpuratus TaxID=7668 RepID=A0A7M7PD73_STRPU|nr:transcriptional adapter 3 [Strongylocentrotus purpuratus]